MKKSITLLDGAIGTSLWEIAARNGADKVPVWRYNTEHPEFVTELTRDYIAAGAEIVLTNTFGANAPAVRMAHPQADPEQIVRAGVRLAKQAAAGSGARVALAAGPLSALMEPWGDLTQSEVAGIYEQMLGAGMDEGADCILLQTFMDLEMMRVAATVARQYPVPVFCAMTYEKVGKTIMGNSVQDTIDVLTPLQIDAIGMNCSLGPEASLPVLREFAAHTDLPLLYKPNAGKPVLAADGSSAAACDAQTFAQQVQPALEYVSYVGGCCGSNVSYIRELKKLL